MKTYKERAERKLTNLVDRYAEKIGHAEMETLLQHLAQREREELPDDAVITVDKIELHPDEAEDEADADAEN